MAADETVITPYRDGPLLVRGPVRLRDQDGGEIVVERATVALCRCGRSRMRPLCDGTHKVIGFRAPSGLEDGRTFAPPADQAQAAAARGSASSESPPAVQASST